MTEQTQQVLEQFLVESIQSLEKIKDFTVSQIPAVLQQLLLWKLTESIIHNTCVIMVTVGLAYLGRYLYKKAILLVAESSYDDGVHYVPLIVTPLACTFVFFLGINFTWLQILIAPKLYLIEYATQLIK